MIYLTYDLFNDFISYIDKEHLLNCNLEYNAPDELVFDWGDQGDMEIRFYDNKIRIFGWNWKGIRQISNEYEFNTEQEKNEVFKKLRDQIKRKVVDENYNIKSKHNKKLYESIMKDVAKTVKKRLYESDDYQEIDDDMFFDALYNYGELTKDDLEEIFGEPLFIDGKEVTGLYASNDLQDINGDEYNEIIYSFINNGRELESVFYTDLLNDEQLDSIYNYLIDNENPNIEFFDSLQDDEDF
jgi:hypothetical protein